MLFVHVAGAQMDTVHWHCQWQNTAALPPAPRQLTSLCLCVLSVPTECPLPRAAAICCEWLCNVRAADCALTAQLLSHAALTHARPRTRCFHEGISASPAPVPCGGDECACMRWLNRARGRVHPGSTWGGGSAMALVGDTSKGGECGCLLTSIISWCQLFFMSSPAVAAPLSCHQAALQSRPPPNHHDVRSAPGMVRPAASLRRHEDQRHQLPHQRAVTVQFSGAGRDIRHLCVAGLLAGRVRAGASEERHAAR